MKELKILERLIGEIKDSDYGIAKKVADAGNKFIKTSQEIELKDKEVKKSGPSVESAQKLISCLRIVSQISQHSHWVTKGTNYYGDHLLFERIYNDVVLEVDGFAEKMVCLAGEESANPIKIAELVNENISKYMGEGTSPEVLINNVLNASKYLMEEITFLYSELESSDGLSLGLDDMLTAMHSSHETHVYLLEQRQK